MIYTLGTIEITNGRAYNALCYLIGLAAAVVPVAMLAIVSGA